MIFIPYSNTVVSVPKPNPSVSMCWSGWHGQTMCFVLCRFFFFLHWSKWHIQQNRTMCGQNPNPLVPHKIYSLPTFSKVHELFSCPHSTTCKTLCIYCTFSTHYYFQNCWKLMQKRMANVVHFWGNTLEYIEQFNRIFCNLQFTIKLYNNHFTKKIFLVGELMYSMRDFTMCIYFFIL